MVKTAMASTFFPWVVVVVDTVDAFFMLTTRGADDLLLVFIPGVSMQLVDCGSKHEPGHHFVLLGDQVPILPGHDRIGAPPGVSYFELVKQTDGRNAYGVGMFDVDKGVAYTFEINRETVFNLFSR